MSTTSKYPPGTKYIHGPRSAPEKDIRPGDLVRIHPHSFVQPQLPWAVGMVETLQEGDMGWTVDVMWTDETRDGKNARRCLPPRLGLDKIEKIHPLERLAHQSDDS